MRGKEIEELNALEADRLGSFLKRADRAYRLTAAVPSKLGIEAPAQHFKTWAEVFPEVAKRVSPPTRTM